MWYKFMQLALDSHNQHTHRKMSLYGNMIVETHV